MSYSELKKFLENYQSDVRIDKGKAQRALDVTWTTFKRWIKGCEDLNESQEGRHKLIDGAALVRHLAKRDMTHWSGLLHEYIENSK